jgi:hypothetical protein|tara:strand:+ start:212 stop:562 length:351 start_codon:yes stop_codon:yes gene_type:complete
MIKNVSFCNFSDIKIINSDLSYQSKTRLDDGQMPENLFLSQLIYIFFNHPDNFHKSINVKLIHRNHKNIMDTFNKIMNHLELHNIYSLYKYDFKIYKTEKDISRFLDLYNFLASYK